MPALAWAALTVVLLPVGVPVVPAEAAQRHGIVDLRGGDYEDEIGWPEIVRTVERAASGAPVVVAANYGEAGALDLLGRGLPPLASGHLSYRYWRPDVDPARGVVVGFDEPALARLCSRFEVVARLEIPYGVENEEAGRPVARWAFRGGSLRAVWPQLVHE